MNNSSLINNLKKTKQQHTIDVNKYNPDINNKYDNVEKIRKEKNYTFSNAVWKPIIGSIDKQKISEDDLKINLEKPNHQLIKSRYEQEMEEREKEKERVKKLADDYAKENNIYKNTTMDEIQKPIELNDEDKALQNIDNTFIELKQNANNIIKDGDNIDQEVLKASINQLDELMKSIQDL
jgi:hypothetical protein